MTALVTADWHLSENPRDRYRFAAMGRLAQLLEQHKVESLVILGDLTENKNHHPSELVNDAVELIHILSELVDNIIFMMGNHDYKDADYPFFYFLRRLKNVDWVRTRCEMEVPGLAARCLFLPHTPNYERDWEGQDMKGFDWIFAHNTFTGASTEHGKRLTGIPLSVFPKDARVIAGDIHTPQTIGCVTYTGSPFTVDFGETFEPRVLLLEGHKMKSVPLPGPQKKLLVLGPGFKLRDLDLIADDVVKVQYNLPADQHEKWPELRDKIREQLQGLGCLVYAVQPVVDKTERVGSVVSKRRVNTDETMVRTFAKQSKVSDDVLATGLDLIQ